MANRFDVHVQNNVIEATVTDKARVVEEWVLEIMRIYSGRQLVIGLDCEWRPNTMATMNNKVATLQLCVANKCIIIQMLYLDYIPHSINNFLDASNVTLVGAEVEDDVRKIRNDYGLVFNAKGIDIQAMAMSRYPVRYVSKPSLKRLAQELGEHYVEKPMHVCRSDWEARVLSGEQIEYACIDAFASYKIGSRLINKY